MSKVIVTAVAIVAGLLSVSASAVKSGAVTRAQVKAELEALQAVGYQLTGEDPTYPAKLQAALMKIRASAVTSETESGYGVPGLEYYFYWHRSADQDQGSRWLREQLMALMGGMGEPR